MTKVFISSNSQDLGPYRAAVRDVTLRVAPAVMLAIVDALAPLGIADVPMPATPSRPWQTIRDARRAPG